MVISLQATAEFSVVDMSVFHNLLRVKLVKIRILWRGSRLSLALKLIEKETLGYTLWSSILKNTSRTSFTFTFHIDLQSFCLEPYTRPLNLYKKIVKADFPTLHDYHCSNTRLPGACELAVYDIAEAKYECDMDEECMAFVSTETKLWTGK